MIFASGEFEFVFFGASKSFRKLEASTVLGIKN
jgi:hypothetical protein